MQHRPGKKKKEREQIGKEKKVRYRSSKTKGQLLDSTRTNNEQQQQQQSLFFTMPGDIVLAARLMYNDTARTNTCPMNSKRIVLQRDAVNIKYPNLKLLSDAWWCCVVHRAHWLKAWIEVMPLRQPVKLEKIGERDVESKRFNSRVVLR
jgi:hypothetical protein